MLTKPKLDTSQAKDIYLGARLQKEEIPYKVFPGVELYPEYVEVIAMSTGVNPLHGNSGDFWKLYIVQSKDNVVRQGKDMLNAAFIPLAVVDNLLSITLSNRKDLVYDEDESVFGLWMDVVYQRNGEEKPTSFPTLLYEYPSGHETPRYN